MKNKELEQLTDTVMEGLDYFQSGRLEELKTDDVYYINAFIKMISFLLKERK